MFVSAIKVKGHTYVRIVESVMKPGSKYSTHKVIQNLGRLDKLIEKHGDPNYLENLKANTGVRVPKRPRLKQRPASSSRPACSPSNPPPTTG